MCGMNDIKLESKQMQNEAKFKWVSFPPFDCRPPLLLDPTGAPVHLAGVSQVRIGGEGGLRGFRRSGQHRSY